MPIADPFPIPSISTALSKKAHPDMRLDFSMTSADDTSAVTITRIGESSPLQGTVVTVGSENLAVNGTTVYSVAQTNCLLRASTRIELSEIALFVR